MIIRRVSFLLEATSETSELLFIRLFLVASCPSNPVAYPGNKAWLAELII